MTDLEPEEAELFGRARRGLSPSARDQERVLLALGPALAMAGAAAPPSDGSKLWRWGRIGQMVVLGLAVAAGYGWGYRAGRQAQPAPVAVKPAPLAPVGASVPTVPAVPSAVPTATVPVVLERVRGPKPTSGVTSGATPKEAPPAAGLDEEVRQLRRIERAIRDGNPRLALAIGDNLDRDIPHGQLLLERRAARLMASCQLDAEAGATPAARYLTDNPQSAYALRLRELCGLTAEPQRNGVSPGTNGAESGGTR